jgi:hypothetical protein
MNFLNKETLIDAAALGAGVVAGRTVVKVAGDKLATTLKLEGETASIVSNLLPIAGGIATLMIGKGNRIATGIANGMFAASAAYYVDYALQKVLKDKYTPTITGNVMMNGVMMNGYGGEDETVLMGAAQDMPNYNSDSFDFTGADAGELDY